MVINGDLTNKNRDIMILIGITLGQTNTLLFELPFSSLIYPLRMLIFNVYASLPRRLKMEKRFTTCYNYSIQYHSFSIFKYL